MPLCGKGPGGAGGTVTAAEGRLTLQLAGARVQLATRCGAWLDAVRRCLGPWLAEGGEGFPVSVEVRPEVAESVGAQPPPSAAAKTVAWATASGFGVRGPGFSAQVDLQGCHARLHSPPALAPLFALLRHLLPVLVDDGLVVHGVGLAAGGRGWVGSGPSGCGKSTLARLFPRAALSDELVAVRRAREGFVVEALPFWGRAPRQVSLAAIYFLRHGQEHRRSPLAATQALQRLAAQVLWPLVVPQRMAAGFALAAELVQRVPCFDLAFAPEAGVWPVLTGEGRAA